MNAINSGTKNRFALAGLTLLALGSLALPQSAAAQQTPPAPDAESADKRLITLDLEDGDLYAAFKALFQQAKVNYTLDPSLKGTTVTAHIKLPFRQAVATLVKTSGLPIALTFENNVYSIAPQKPSAASPDPAPEPAATIAEDAAPASKGLLGRLRIRHLNSIDIAVMLGAKIYPYTTSLAYHGNNPFAPVAVGSGAAVGAPGVANGAPNSANGANGNTTGSGTGKSGSFLLSEISPDDLLATDMDAYTLIALYRGP